MQQFIYGFASAFGLIIVLAIIISRKKTTAYKVLNKSHDFIESVNKTKDEKNNHKE